MAITPAPKMAPSRVRGIALNVQTIRMLEEMAKYYNSSASAVVRELIIQEYEGHFAELKNQPKEKR